jgi:hypothetical protein
MATKAQLSGKKKEPQEKRVDAETLSFADRYYIENNGNLSIEELATSLCKPIKIVAAYCEEYLKRNPSKKKYRAKEMMDRPTVKGVVSMTGAASMAIDDADKPISLQDITNAVLAGDMEHAKTLKEKFDKQAEEAVNAISPKIKNAIHFIQSPEDF